MDVLRRAACFAIGLVGVGGFACLFQRVFGSGLGLSGDAVLGLAWGGNYGS